MHEFFETAGLHIHDHDGQANARFAQGHALVGKGHSEVIGPLVLEEGGNFYTARAIGKGFYHDHYFGLWPNAATVKAVVVEEGVKVDFKHGLVHFKRQLALYPLKAKFTRTLEEQGSVYELLARQIGEQLLGGFVKTGF